MSSVTPAAARKIVIAGGSGFIGSALAEDLGKLADVSVLSRNPSKVPGARGVHWDPANPAGEWVHVVADADVVINLAGANISEGRWNDPRKRELVDSRVESTRAIVAALRTKPKDRLLVNASATGFYGARGSEILDESSAPGTSFLASLAQQWEAEAKRAEDVARVVILRIGIVLDRSGGALAKTLTPFRLGAGGVMGSGDQYWSWIDRVDLVGLVRWAIETPAARGVYNATAPQPVTNREFTRTLAALLRRPAILPAPGFALRLALGEMADALLLTGQRVVPRRAEAEGFRFQYPQLERSLRRAIET
jgi:uncharacterized protein